MGEFIRLAYADTVTGPWKVHEPGDARARRPSSGRSRIEETLEDFYACRLARRGEPVVQVWHWPSTLATLALSAASSVVAAIDSQRAVLLRIRCPADTIVAVLSAVMTVAWTVARSTSSTRPEALSR
jgi:hypothetical protein